MNTEDLDASLVSLRASITKSRCLHLKPDWLVLRRLFWVRKAETWLNITSVSVL